MFAEAPDTTELWQGDIIQGLFFPIIDVEQFKIIGRPSEDSHSQDSALTLSPVVSRVKDKIDHFNAQIEVVRGYSIVLSQCCDLALHNGKPKAPYFVVSPLLDILYPITNDPEKFALFKENTLDNFLSQFFIPQQSPLSQDYAVDFGRLVSIPKSGYSFALKNKVLQMDDKSRVRLKLKLAHHFGRPTQDEMEAGIYPNSDSILPIERKDAQ
jgi:hypothetical protein